MDQIEADEKRAYLLKIRRKLKRRATRHELIVKKALDELKDAGIWIKYRFQRIFYSGDYMAVADFYLYSPYHAILEIDGPSHFTEKGIGKDRWRKEKILRSHAYKFVHISNDFIDRQEQGYGFRLKMLEILKTLKKTPKRGCLNYW